MSVSTVNYARHTPPALAMPQRGLHWFACVMVVLTVGLIAAGAMVTSTGSGLSVPDWPTTYGENMFTFHPSKWVGGIFYEHGHRLIASTIGFLTIILAIFARMRARRRAIRVLGWVALGTVIAQGTLGGLTVIYLLPTWISVFHACLAQTFLCILVTMAVLTHPSRGTDARVDSGRGPTWRNDKPRNRWSGIVLTLVLVIFAQLIAGAIMRHTESGLAVPDFPTAYGQVVPSLSDESIHSYNDTRAFDYQLSPVTRAQIVSHLVHRAGAIAVVLAVMVALVVVVRRGDRSACMAVCWVVVLIAVQIVLGMYTVWTQKVPVVATAHVAVGAATLAAAWRSYLIARSSRISEFNASPAMAGASVELAGGAV